MAVYEAKLFNNSEIYFKVLVLIIQQLQISVVYYEAFVMVVTCWCAGAERCA
jgi:hypothetical protein